MFSNTRNKFFPFRCSIFSNTFYFQDYRNKSTYTLIEKGKVYLYNRKLFLNLTDFVAVGMYIHPHYFYNLIRIG